MRWKRYQRLRHLLRFPQFAALWQRQQDALIKCGLLREILRELLLGLLWERLGGRLLGMLWEPLPGIPLGISWGKIRRLLTGLLRGMLCGIPRELLRELLRKHNCNLLSYSFRTPRYCS